jgi:HK97 family phage major capsid protein
VGQGDRKDYQVTIRDDLRDELRAVKLKAHQLAEQAEGRDFTAEELTTAHELQSKAAELEPRIAKLDEDKEIEAAIKALGDPIAGEPASGHHTNLAGQPAEPAAPATRAKAEPPAWSTRNRRSSGWAKATAQTVDRVARASGTKALVSGSLDVASPIFPDITRIAEYPLTLLDLLVDRTAIASNNFQFIRQTVRTNLAAPVPDGELKPTSVYTVVDVEDRVRTIAHLSQPVPERLFSDHADLLDFLGSEMETGLRRAVEDQIINGDGEDENMTGLLATSGTLTQAWSTDLLTTLRKAVTELAVNGEVPNAWAINPVDVEVLDLLQDNEARMYFAGPQQQLTNSNPVWSLPIVQSLAVPEGVAVLGDWNYFRLVVREDAKLDLDRSGENFTKNLVTARVEGRFGVAVRRPSAFCEVDLTA